MSILIGDLIEKRDEREKKGGCSKGVRAEKKFKVWNKGGRWVVYVYAPPSPLSLTPKRTNKYPPPNAQLRVKSFAAPMPARSGHCPT